MMFMSWFLARTYIYPKYFCMIYVSWFTYMMLHLKKNEIEHLKRDEYYAELQSPLHGEFQL
jgi:hypothetical protein